MRFFMSLCPSKKGLPSLWYVIILVSLFLTGLLLLVTFSAAVIWLPFDGNQIICVDCVFFCWDAFCAPLINATTSWLGLGLTLLVITEAVVLLVILLLLRLLFIDCSIAGSFSIRHWLLQGNGTERFTHHNHISWLSGPRGWWLCWVNLLVPLPIFCTYAF